MSQTLEYLIEKARTHVMTPAEKREQLISFAFGNMNLHNPTIARAEVEEAYDRLRAKGLL